MEFDVFSSGEGPVWSFQKASNHSLKCTKKRQPYRLFSSTEVEEKETKGYQKGIYLKVRPDRCYVVGHRNDVCNHLNLLKNNFQPSPSLLYLIILRFLVPSKTISKSL